MDDPHGAATVPEHARFCLACDGPVGRGRAGRPGRERGTCPWCRAPFDLAPALAPGDAAEGSRSRYRIRCAWRPGSRGWIYLADAEDLGTSRHGEPVVLTRLEGPEGVAAGALAVHEPRELLDLAVPGLVPARDVAVAVEPAGSSRHLVLDHVPGRRIDADRPLAPLAALDAVLGLTAPLAALHARGLLHADVSPANLLVGPDGVTLMDLGSVRRIGDRTSDVWGTTGFLAPEITPGGAGPSVASEVYALGRTLAVLLMEFDHTRGYTLRLPGPQRAPVLAAHPDLAALLARATDPDPARRHTDVADFAARARTVRAAIAGNGHHVTERPATDDNAGDCAGDPDGGGAATP